MWCDVSVKLAWPLPSKSNSCTHTHTHEDNAVYFYPFYIWRTIKWIFLYRYSFYRSERFVLFVLSLLMVAMGNNEAFDSERFTKSSISLSVYSHGSHQMSFISSFILFGLSHFLAATHTQIHLWCERRPTVISYPDSIVILDDEMKENRYTDMHHMRPKIIFRYYLFLNKTKIIAHKFSGIVPIYIMLMAGGLLGFSIICLVAQFDAQLKWKKSKYISLAHDLCINCKKYIRENCVEAKIDSSSFCDKLLRSLHLLAFSTSYI